MSPDSRPSDPRPPAQVRASAPDPHVEATCDYATEAQAAEMVKILDEYLAGIKAGQTPSKEELIARHPELASQLQACLAGLEFIHAAETPGHGRSQRLGDYRIIREVGRGGMGAVYEAEQVSLGRRVALKILRFGGVSDPEAVERFQREAETIANLHHTNIVPIFNVGSERGVNYYAMQFIEGRSLAEVLAETKQPLAPEQVAEWGLQAAEALAHAHQRGVIHRDVKPSNLLLDKENRLWLTDFGLARRMDDVTLSLTGALLGTPRYMSPEQAIASKKRVDHRSDLFSLGATLYELVTGKPAFAGDTPHDVIQQILTGEPTPIRQLNASVPRDLETIVMKCLAKEPSQRYEAARALADDLRAFLDGRPIRARRASLGERASRWIKAQQRSVRLAATAATVTLAVTVAAIFGWSGYDAWRQASITLDAVRPPLVAEILNDEGQVLRVETAPMQNPVSLPAGDYRLRVAGNETLSQTFDVTLARGSQSAYKLDLVDQMLIAPRAIEGGFDVVDFGTEQGLVLWNQKGIALTKRFQPMGWSKELDAKQFPDPPRGVGFRWPWHPPGGTYSGHGPWDTRPWVAPTAVDIDGQGAPDLIVAGRHQAWLMALSGDDGRILWFAPRGHDLAIPPPPAGQFHYLVSATKSAVVGTPIFGHDVNDDGTPDVIATLMDVGEKPQLSGERYQARCWVEAISGKSGETLWSYDVPPEWFKLPDDDQVPYDLRWFAVSGGGTMSGGRGTMLTSRHLIREISLVARSGSHGYRPAAVELIDSGGTKQVAIVAGKHFVALNADSGAVAQPPMDIGALPGKTCQLHDVDGDGHREVILLEELGPVSFPTPAKPRLVVWSPQQRKQLWSKTLDAEWPVQAGWTIDAARWPLVADLNHDGKCEVVTPDGRYDRGLAGGRFGSAEIPSGVVAVYAGDTGAPLWTRRLVSMDQQIDQFLAGPDLDEDGWRELYVVTLEGLDFRIHVDAMSGKSGRTLWSASHAPPRSNNTSRDFYLLPPQWWHSGEGGWPQLVVYVRESVSTEPQSMVCTISAGTGKLLHVGSGMSDVRPADIDRDGAEDLLVFDSKILSARDKGGRLHAIRGIAGEPWRKLGPVGEPVEDFDNDGVIDLVHSDGDSTLEAASGRTGKLLWRERPVTANLIQVGSARPRLSRDASHAHLSGDLDGDGINDLLLWVRDGIQWQRHTVFHAVSGRTGKRLWTVEEVTIQILNQVLAAEAHDLDGDGKLEVVWLAAMDYGYPSRNSLSSQDSQLWLLVTSGQNGKLKWSHPLSEAYGMAPGQMMQVQIQETNLPLVVSDVSGDGISDVIVPAIPPAGRDLETRIVSGSDGKLLWSRPYPTEPNQQVQLADWIPPAVCDLDVDGRAEVVVLEHALNLPDVQAARPKIRMAALEGRSGRERWQWTSPMPQDYWNPLARTGKGNIMRPLVLRHGKQQRIAALMPGNDGQIVVADAKGNVQMRKADHQTSSSGLWVCDADGDGSDELVAAIGQSVHVTDAGQPDRNLWSRSLNASGQRIMDVASRQGQPPLIAVALDATDNSVTGLDAKTGRRLWTCGGPILRDDMGSSYLVPQQMALLDSAARTPHVYFGYGSVSRVRQAALDEPSLAADAVLAAAGRVPPNLAGIDQDPRWARNLPWVESHMDPRQAVAFVGWGMFFGLMLYVLPGAYLLKMIVRRRFSLRMLLVLPLVVGLVITAALFKGPLMESEFHRVLPRLGVGSVFAPPVIGIGLVAWWSATGKWRRPLVWLAATVVLSLLAAVMFLWNAPPLEGEEHYIWTGWYLIWFLGAYFTSCIMIVVLPIEYLAVAAWKRWRGQPMPAVLPQPETIVAGATKAAVER